MELTREQLEAILTERPFTLREEMAWKRLNTREALAGIDNIIAEWRQRERA